MILTGPFLVNIFYNSGKSVLDSSMLSLHITAYWHLTLHWPSKTRIMFVSHRDLKFAPKKVLYSFLWTVVLGNIWLPRRIPARVLIVSASKTYVGRTGASYSSRFLLPAFVPFCFGLVTCLGNQVTAQSWLLILIYFISGRWRHKDSV